MRIYNVRSGKIVNRFMDICETSNSAAEAVYSVLNELNEKISQLLDTSKTFHNCTSVCVDNTSANIDIR